MSIERQQPKLDRAPIIGSEDKSEAFGRMVETMNLRKPGWQPHHARPDDSILAHEECTPSEAAARQDFEALNGSLSELGISLKDARVLEIGSGMGHLLTVLQKEGIDAIGIDFSPRDYRRTEHVHIIDTPLGAFKPDKTGHFGVILAKNVFDDDRYPFQIYKEMLAEIDTLLESGAVFVKIGTGNFKEEDIPSGWQRLRGSGGTYGTEIFQKS